MSDSCKSELAVGEKDRVGDLVWGVVSIEVVFEGAGAVRSPGR